MANIAVCAIASIVLIISPLSGKNVNVPNEHADHSRNGQTDSPPAKPRENNEKPRSESDKTADGDQKPARYRRDRYVLLGLVINGILALGTLVIAAFSILQATAAKRTVDLLISKERARLRINMRPLDLTPKYDAIYGVDFTVNIHGETAAYVTENLCVAYEFPLEFINEPQLGEAVMFPMHSLPNVISPKSAPFEDYALLDLNSLILTEIKQGRLFVGIRGFIKYKDVFDGEHETRFRYVWKFTKGFDSLFDHGNWEKCGTAEENYET